MTRFNRYQTRRRAIQYIENAIRDLENIQMKILDLILLIRLRRGFK